MSYSGFRIEGQADTKCIVLRERMKNRVNKSIWIILPIVLFSLFSYASAQPKQIEPKDADFYRNRGVAYSEKHQYDQAISDFTDALKINPKDSYAYYYRGIAYGERNQVDQAIDDFTKALEIEPNAVSARYYRGIAYREKGQFDWAIEDFTKILQIDPKAASTYYHRGVAYYFKKDYEKSWKDVKKAQDLGYQIPSDFLDKVRKASGR